MKGGKGGQQTKLKWQEGEDGGREQAAGEGEVARCGKQLTEEERQGVGLLKEANKMGDTERQTWDPPPPGLPTRVYHREPRHTPLGPRGSPQSAG